MLCYVVFWLLLVWVCMCMIWLGLISCFVSLCFERYGVFSFVLCCSVFFCVVLFRRVLYWFGLVGMFELVVVLCCYRLFWVDLCCIIFVLVCFVLVCCALFCVGLVSCCFFLFAIWCSCVLVLLCIVLCWFVLFLFVLRCSVLCLCVAR